MWLVSTLVPVACLFPGPCPHPTLPIWFVLIASVGTFVPGSHIPILNRLVVWGYYTGLVCGMIAPFIRREQPAMARLVRVGAIGLLLPWALLIPGNSQTDWLPGLFLFAAGGSFVCLGVWLIPPRAAKPPDSPRPGTMLFPSPPLGWPGKAAQGRQPQGPAEKLWPRILRWMERHL